MIGQKKGIEIPEGKKDEHIEGYKKYRKKNQGDENTYYGYAREVIKGKKQEAIGIKGVVTMVMYIGVITFLYSVLYSTVGYNTLVENIIVWLTYGLITVFIYHEVKTSKASDEMLILGVLAKDEDFMNQVSGIEKDRDVKGKGVQ